jgi:hypothetical protein
MSYTYSLSHRVLHFRQPAGTSRGVYTTRDIWLLTLTDDIDEVVHTLQAYSQQATR